jgi:phage-related protein
MVIKYANHIDMKFTIEYFHCVVILHAFVKKTQDTPEQELKIARSKDEGGSTWLN